jgi:hypothetical protein
MSALVLQRELQKNGIHLQRHRCTVESDQKHAHRFNRGQAAVAAAAVLTAITHGFAMQVGWHGCSFQEPPQACRLATQHASIQDIEMEMIYRFRASPLPLLLPVYAICKSLRVD